MECELHLLKSFLRVPIGACAFAVILIGMPANFPYATPTLPKPPAASRGRYALTMRASPLSCSLQRLDIFGAALLLAASFLLVTPLLQVSATLNWHSPTTIALLALSVAFWIAFLGWEWYLSRSNWVQEPIFPWRFVHNRVWMGVLLYVATPLSTFHVHGYLSVDTDPHSWWEFP